MNLPVGGDEGHPENTNALYRLFEKVTPSVATIVPTGTPITQQYSYSRDALIGSLVDLIRTFQPFVVRMLDPLPY
jgi:hypothetical protein